MGGGGVGCFLKASYGATPEGQPRSGVLARVAGGSEDDVFPLFSDFVEIR